ncbi:putative transcription elongation factor [Sphingomonas changbaiensis NBRC 104936]|uniref:Putative transcription elongation factor n=2 Tax=Sphingomonas changbaiensis TaxID=529705 RepID=A0A0E9ML30_9SPHN|nr:GreA/GreB family elongation factor [Sphingomonas changbaiensis]GAO37845.1 putative transcription elongation factor [Sphingomonas changbaiensis NBRC 104936]
MSVAFRRDSDEEHKEPRFERTIPSGPNYVTARGLALIAARIAELEANLAVAADEVEREGIARDLRYWNTRQVTAIKAPAPPAGEAAFGSCLRVRIGKSERTIHIVGDDEADPATGHIPFSAPLARALVGAAAGDRIDFGAGVEVLEVLEPAP